MENTNIHRVYLAYSSNIETRRMSTSGGLGSSLVKFVLDEKIANCALSFNYNSQKLMYEPEIIYSSKEYKISGSIYHEIDIYSFIKRNIEKIKGVFICFALPCQVRAIRAILNKNNIKSIIIQLTCSSQQSIEATEYLMKRLKIKREDVISLKYRGDGWPSGIKILLKDDSTIFVPNLNSIWTEIFHSKLFCMPRCLKCNPDIRTNSDLSIADPWRIISPKEEHIGITLCMTNSKFSSEILNAMAIKKHIILKECNQDKFYYSQESIILKKRQYLKHKIFINKISKLFHNNIYRYFVLNYNGCFKIHIFLSKFIDKLILKI